MTFYWHGLTSIAAWKRNLVPSKIVGWNFLRISQPSQGSLGICLRKILHDKFEDTNCLNVLEITHCAWNYTFEVMTTSPRGQWFQCLFIPDYVGATLIRVELLAPNINPGHPQQRSWLDCHYGVTWVTLQNKKISIDSNQTDCMLSPIIYGVRRPLISSRHWALEFTLQRYMTASWHGNIRSTGPLWKESVDLHTGPVMRGVASLLLAWKCCKQTLEMSVFWDAMVLMWHSIKIIKQ